MYSETKATNEKTADGKVTDETATANSSSSRHSFHYNNYKSYYHYPNNYHRAYYNYKRNDFRNGGRNNYSRTHSNHSHFYSPYQNRGERRPLDTTQKDGEVATQQPTTLMREEIASSPVSKTPESELYSPRTETSTETTTTSIDSTILLRQYVKENLVLNGTKEAIEKGRDLCRMCVLHEGINQAMEWLLKMDDSKSSDEFENQLIHLSEESFVQRFEKFLNEYREYKEKKSLGETKQQLTTELKKWQEFTSCIRKSVQSQKDMAKL